MRGAELRAALDELDMRPVDLAARCGAHRTTVYKWLDDGPNGLAVPQYAATIVSLLRENRRLRVLAVRTPQITAVPEDSPGSI